MHPHFQTHYTVSISDLVAEIYAALQDVTRQGGRSWAECIAIDYYCDIDEATEIAGGPDDGSNWRLLVENRAWMPFLGPTFCLMDPIGFRYYLAPTLIRMAHGTDAEWFDGQVLQHLDRLAPQPESLFSITMLQSIAKFVAFMANIEIKNYEDETSPTVYIDAFTNRWHKYLSEHP